MNLRRLILTGASCILLSVVFTGCAINQDSVKTDAVREFSVNAKEFINPRNSADEGLTPKLAAAGANDFAFNLTSALVKNVNDENFVCSPFSVWMPLAALVNATDETNKPALLEALGAAGISADDINNAASRMLYDLTGQRDKQDFEDNKRYYPNGYEFKEPLKIANAIFVGDNVTLENKFAKEFMDYYRGSSFNVDFSSLETVTTINEWASDNTEGLITDIIQEFDPNTVAAIANAIYFSDRWSWEFNPKNTVEDIFHAPGGDGNAFFMLREGGNQTYYEDDKIQAMPLQFKRGGGMYIILPKNGSANDFLADMTNEYFKEIQEGSISATGKLLLPRFSIDSGVMRLNDVLSGLGVPLFEAETAPLTGLVKEDIPVWLSSAFQKAFIEVDEKGATAAAVTVMLMAEGAAMPVPTEPFEMVCNKPFAFILYGETYDGGRQVLFTGVVNNANE